MKIDVKWKDIDQESKQKDKSRAKITELTIGNKSITSPSRGIKIFKGTSDFALWNNVTGGLLNPKAIGLIHMGVKPETINNLTESNGKFNKKITEINSRLRMIDDKVIKMIYPRISNKDANKIPIKQETTRATIHFLNKAEGNEANIIPLAPTHKTVENFDGVIKSGIEDTYFTLSKPKPLVGYIPNFENPLDASALAEKYVNLDIEVRMFFIDFANGKRYRTVLEVVDKLYTLHKRGDLEDFYIHGVNVPKDYDKTSATPFYDLTLPIEGIDSFNDILFPIYPAKLKSEKGVGDYIKSKRYSVASEYGSFSFAELKDRNLLGEQCNCPVCKNITIEKLYKTQDYLLFGKKLNVHRIHLEMVELEEHGDIIKENNSLIDYLRSKPMVQPHVDRITQSLKGKII